MRGERGVVLLNALIVVLVLASVAAALLTRSEAALVRAGATQTTEQLNFHLDAAESLTRMLLAKAGRGGEVVHRRQEWARETHLYRIGEGQVKIDIIDLQGRMNVNWLAGSDDPFVEEAFRRLFREIDLPAAMVDDIRDFLDPDGPRSLPTYLRRDTPVQPRGGEARMLEDLRVLRGMDAKTFATLSEHVAALPWDMRVNINTATGPVLRAMLFPFPSEVQREFGDPDRTGAIEHLRELRDMTVAIRETEDLEDLPLDRLTLNTAWFQADITAELDGQVASRRVILHRERPDDDEPEVVYRWALRD